MLLRCINIKNILDIEPSDFELGINDQLFLNTSLMEIRGKSISYSS